MLGQGQAQGQGQAPSPLRSGSFRAQDSPGPSPGALPGQAFRGPPSGRPPPDSSLPLHSNASLSHSSITGSTSQAQAQYSPNSMGHAVHVGSAGTPHAALARGT